MKITINNSVEMATLLGDYGMRPGANLLSLVRRLLQTLQNHDRIFIKIHKQLLPPSYAVNPTMFCKSVAAADTGFDHITLTRKRDFFMLRAGENKAPHTFIAKAIDSITKHGVYTRMMRDVPITYRERPSVLAKTLRDRTGHQIAVTAKNLRITWRVKRRVHSRVDKR